MTAIAWVAALVAACGGGGSPAGPNHLTGSVQGNRFENVAAAYWIGMPSAGSPPVIVFLLESALDCAAISVPNWDKTIGTSQVLELSAPRVEAATFAVSTDATVAYLRGDYNPDATSGQLTISSIDPQVAMTGSFTASFSASDMLAGEFDAEYCATGVEP